MEQNLNTFKLMKISEIINRSHFYFSLNFSVLYSVVFKDYKRLENFYFINHFIAYYY